MEKMPPQNPFGMTDYLCLAAYLLILVAIGIYLSRREKSVDDYFLAGRRIPWWAAGVSIFATQLSAITFMAIPAKAFSTDWTFILVNAGIILIAPLVVYFYLPFFRRLQLTSVYEYLEHRFDLRLRILGSLSFLLLQTGRMAIVLFLPAIALSTVTGIDIYFCILVMGLFATVYTFLGGVEAVIWTDVLQVVVLAGGAVFSLVLIIASLEDGLSEIISIGLADHKFRVIDWTWDPTQPGLWVVLVGNLFAVLIPYTSDQTVIQRYLTTPDEQAAARSIWTNAVLTVPATLLFFGMGTALYVFYTVHPSLLDRTVSNDAIFPFFISQSLPDGVAGVVLAGLFAASMSSLDSSINSMSTVLTIDFYERLGFARETLSSLAFARISTILLGVLGTLCAVLIAGFEIQSLWDLFLGLIGLLGSSLAGIFALGIFTRRATSAGALAGGVISAGCLVLIQQFTELHFFLYAFVGIPVCFAVGYGWSKTTPRTVP